MEKDFSELIENLRKAEQIPDSKLSFLLTDPARMKSLRAQLFSPVKSKNPMVSKRKMTKKETEDFFNMVLETNPDNKGEYILIEDKNTDRQVIERLLVYYKARWDVTPPRNNWTLKEALFCIGQGDVATDKDGRKKYDNGNADWMNRICEEAGISFEKASIESEPQKSEAQKKAEREKRKVQIPTGELPVPVPTDTDVPSPSEIGSEATPVASAQAIPSETDIPLTTISVDGFWDYHTACEIIEAEPEPYLVEGMFRKGTINILGATQNAGKTLLALDIMGCVASGSNFLIKPDKTGGFKCHQGACILLDYEGDKIDTASRLRATIDTYSEISRQEPDDIPILAKYMPLDWIGSDKDFPTKVYKAISALPEPYNNPAVIVFDTYSSFADVENENDSTQAQKVFNRFKELKTLFHDEVTIFVPMHLRKLNGTSFENLSMDDLRGTSAAAAAGSDIWFLSEVKGNSTTKKFKQVKSKGRQRSDEVKTLSLAYENNDDGSFSRVRFLMIEGTGGNEEQAKQTERKQRNKEKRKKEIVAFIATHPMCSVNRICKGSKDNPQDRLEMNIKTCTPLVNELLNEGRIHNLSDSENIYCLVLNPGHKDNID